MTLHCARWCLVVLLFAGVFAFGSARAQITVPNNVQMRLNQSPQGVQVELTIPKIVSLFNAHAKKIRIGRNKCDPLQVVYSLKDLKADRSQLETFGSYTARIVECRTVKDGTVTQGDIRIQSTAVPFPTYIENDEPVGTVISVAAESGFRFSFTSSITDNPSRYGRIDSKRVYSTYNTQISAAFTRFFDQLFKTAAQRLASKTSPEGKAFAAAVQRKARFSISMQMNGANLKIVMAESGGPQELARGCSVVPGAPGTLTAQKKLAGATFCAIRSNAPLKSHELIVIHYSATTSLSATVNFMRQPKASSSLHFLVGRDGEIVQLLPLTQRASHAGTARWRGRPRVNDFSIGISLINAGELKLIGSKWQDWTGAEIPRNQVFQPDERGSPKGQKSGWQTYPDAQMKALAKLVRVLMKEYGIEQDAVLGNDDIDPLRKIDPGPAFEWKTFRRNLR